MVYFNSKFQKKKKQLYIYETPQVFKKFNFKANFSHLPKIKVNENWNTHPVIENA